MTTSTQKAQRRMSEVIVSEGITVSIQNTTDSPRWRDYHSLSTYKIIARRPALRGRPNVFSFYMPTSPGADRPKPWDVFVELGLAMAQMMDVSSFAEYCKAFGLAKVDETPESRAKAERSYVADLSHVRCAEDFFGDDALLEIMEISTDWLEG